MTWTSVVSVDVERRAAGCTEFEGDFIRLDLLTVGQGYERMRGAKNISKVLAQATGNTGLLFTEVHRVMIFGCHK